MIDPTGSEAQISAMDSTVQGTKINMSNWAWYTINCASWNQHICHSWCLNIVQVACWSNWWELNHYMHDGRDDSHGTIILTDAPGFYMSREIGPGVLRFLDDKINSGLVFLSIISVLKILCCQELRYNWYDEQTPHKALWIFKLTHKPRCVCDPCYELSKVFNR